ncbi:MAG TPA: anti-sigma regulatory factor [Synechococcales cyanobacterium M55_K2018_004]|nr:anti-sigma regulatory factor [Synechococcales cyanobacterium M55_K2018_004]
MIAITPRPSGRRWGTISFASTLHLDPVLDLLMVDVPRRWHAEVRLGLQEALVNAAKHGNNLDPRKTVLVEFYVVDDQHWWIISDQGSGFTPPSCSQAINCVEKPLDEQQGCGRGLYILHQIFDQVNWNHCGTELRLCKQVRNRARLPLVS